jgi:hypothetical protein
VERINEEKTKAEQKMQQMQGKEGFKTPDKRKSVVSQFTPSNVPK